MWMVLMLTIMVQIGAGVLAYFLPAMERRERMFGRPFLNAAETNDAWRWWRRIVIAITVVCVMSSLLGGGQALQEAGDGGGLGTALWIGFSVAQPFLLIGAWVGMRVRIPPTPPKTDDLNVRRASLRRREDPTPVLKRLLIYAPVAVIGITMLSLWHFWDRIPERYPIHWNMAGEVDRWGGKSAGTLVDMPMIAGATWAVLYLFLRIGMFDYMPARRKFGFEMLLIGIMWVVVIPLCVTQAMLPFAGKDGMKALILVHILAPVAVAAVILPIWMKVREKLPEEEKPTPAEINRDDDRHWRWGGLFYVNAEDPALWVEKKLGAGPTPNMAHWQGWAMLVGVAIVIVATMILVAMQV